MTPICKDSSIADFISAVESFSLHSPCQGSSSSAAPKFVSFGEGSNLIRDLSSLPYQIPITVYPVGRTAESFFRGIIRSLSYRISGDEAQDSLRCSRAMEIFLSQKHSFPNFTDEQRFSTLAFRIINRTNHPVLAQTIYGNHPSLNYCEYISEKEKSLPPRSSTVFFCQRKFSYDTNTDTDVDSVRDSYYLDCILVENDVDYSLIKVKSNLSCIIERIVRVYDVVIDRQESNLDYLQCPSTLFSWKNSQTPKIYLTRTFEKDEAAWETILKVFSLAIQSNREIYSDGHIIFFLISNLTRNPWKNLTVSWENAGSCGLQIDILPPNSAAILYTTVEKEINREEESLTLSYLFKDRKREIPYQTPVLSPPDHIFDAIRGGFSPSDWEVVHHHAKRLKVLAITGSSNKPN